MDINATLFVEMVIFMAFVLLTMKYVWPPINAALDERRLHIEEGLRQAEEGKLRLAESTGEAKKTIEEAKLQAKKIVEKADSQATTILQQAKTEAVDQKQKIVDSAQQDIDHYIASQKEAISHEIVNVASSISEKLLGEKIDAKKDKAMLNQLTGIAGNE